MEFYKVPMGFGMALTMNFQALNAYNAMTETEKQAVVSRAFQAQSEQEMHDIVRDIVSHSAH